MTGFDIDGVITFGHRPGPNDIIITGRSFEEAPGTLKYLRALGINNDVHFAPVRTVEKNHLTSGNHKVDIIEKFGITLFYEDEPLQADIIRRNCPGTAVILLEKPSKALLDDAIAVQTSYYEGTPAKSVVDHQFLYHIYNHPEAPIFAPKNEYEIVVLLSGGIDSFVAYHYAKSKFNKVTAVYVDYGYPYASVEKEAILRLGIDNLEPFVDYSHLAKTQRDAAVDWGEIFPGRNWILSIIASDFIQSIGQIWMSAIGGEVKELWGDKSHFFFNRGSRILSESTAKDIIITSPFKDMTKGELIKWYVDAGYDVELLKKTVSCHFIDDVNQSGCGQCMGCAHRYIGMKYNGIDEDHRSNVREFSKGLYLAELSNPMTSFSRQRLHEIKTVLINE